MKVTKMQGRGNDYLYFYGDVEKPEELSVKLSDRHFGVGSDGIILILPSKIADFRMRIFNADGSEARMCGNGIRCVGKYVYDKGYTDKTKLSIETLSGIKHLDMSAKNGAVYKVTVDMGRAEANMPVTLSALGQDVTLTPVSVGNPHGVIFTDDAENAPLDTLGAALEKHEYFPEGVNVEFVTVIDKNTLRMRVWERGSGITMACGTGSCASVAAAVKAGYCRRNEDVAVILDGGTLHITILDDDSVLMTGPAAIVCECEVI
ncbi:MAG: diaminopimelate epimerase [Oscillospiraceae bacterium]|nr:diaminopimelate epimerase [Oscillospiraceae bacterium]